MIVQLPKCELTTPKKEFKGVYLLMEYLGIRLSHRSLSNYTTAGIIVLLNSVR
jgi:hypothetical protein